MAIKTPQMSQSNINAAIEPNTNVDSGVGSAFGTIAGALTSKKVENQVARSTANFEVQRAAFQNQEMFSDIPEFQLSERSIKLIGGVEKSQQAIQQAQASGQISPDRAHTLAEMELRKQMARSPALAEEFQAAAKSVGFRGLTAGLDEATGLYASLQKQLADAGGSRDKDIRASFDTQKSIALNAGFDDVVNTAAQLQGLYGVDVANNYMNRVSGPIARQAATRNAVIEAEEARVRGDAGASRAAFKATGEYVHAVKQGIPQTMAALMEADPTIPPEVVEEFLTSLRNQGLPSKESTQIILGYYQNARDQAVSSFNKSLISIDDPDQRARLTQAFTTEMESLDASIAGGDAADLIATSQDIDNSRAYMNMTAEQKRVVSVARTMTEAGLEVPEGDTLRLLQLWEAASVNEDGVINAINPTYRLEAQAGRDKEEVRQETINELGKFAGVRIEALEGLTSAELTQKIPTIRQVIIQGLKHTNTPEGITKQLENLENLNNISAKLTTTEAVDTYDSIQGQMSGSMEQLFRILRRDDVLGTPDIISFERDGTITLAREARGVRGNKSAKQARTMVNQYNNLVNASQVLAEMTQKDSSRGTTAALADHWRAIINTKLTDIAEQQERQQKRGKVVSGRGVSTAEDSTREKALKQQLDYINSVFGDGGAVE